MTGSTAADRLHERLAARGFAWPAPLQHFESLGSTNDWLKARAREAAPEWSVCIADRQTAGRGRQGRSWVSPAGNVLLSVLLRPRVAPELLTVLPLTAGLAVAQAVAESGVDAAVKWPNDVVVGGRKLAGVLAEAVSSGAGLDAVVLGIGVNVGLDPASLPEDLRPHVTSIALESGLAQDPSEVAAAVLARLTVCYDALQRGHAPRLLAEWRTRSVQWWGRPVRWRSGQETGQGVARDVDESGSLLLELEDGSLRRLMAGEVHELRPAGEGPPSR